jgi:hypothetical protein
MTSRPDAAEETREKRLALLKAVEDEVSRHLGLAPLKPNEPPSSPWIGRARLYDLVLYQQMNRLGVRISDIPGEIHKELSKLVP